jgi:hypothetical protein
LCNAWNHSYSCTCGWGGDGHLGRSLGGHSPVRATRRPGPSRFQGHGKQAFSSFTEPNARCPVCEANVYFYQSPNGGRVFFDELGPPWPKHPCTDHPRGGSGRALPATVADSTTGLSRPAATWQADGWRPIEIGSSVKEPGTNVITCVDAVTREVFKVHLGSPLVVTGQTVATMLPWDQVGRSSLSYVELDSKAAPIEVSVTRAVPSQSAFAEQKLEALIAEAEGIGEGDPGRALRRHGELESMIERWAQHVAPDVAELLWSRFRRATDRRLGAFRSAQAATRTTKDELIAKMDSLAQDVSAGGAQDRLEGLLDAWRESGSVERSEDREFERRFAAATEVARKAQAAKTRRRDIERRQALKGHLIHEMRSLSTTVDLRGTRRLYNDLLNRWAKTGAFKKDVEAEYVREFDAASDKYLAACSPAENARQLQSRRARKFAAVGAAETAAESLDQNVVNAEFQRLSAVWRTIGEVSAEFDAAMWTRFQTAFLLGRNVEARPRVRHKLALIDDLAALCQQNDWAEAADRYVILLRRWAFAPMPDEQVEAVLWSRWLTARNTLFAPRGIPDLEAALRIVAGAEASASAKHGDSALPLITDELARLRTALAGTT